ncbi:MAG: hypothetical protein ABIJ86_14290 [Spirochaetota bacterium]
MTTRQIADAVGKDERTVQRWAKRIGDKMSSIGDKLASIGDKLASIQKSGKPADYDLDETCSIIEMGLGRNAASLFRENARHTLPATPATAIGDIVRETVTALLPAIVAAVRGLVPEHTLALPPAPDLSYRDQLRRVINQGAARVCGHREAWNELYTQFYYSWIPGAQLQDTTTSHQRLE